MIRTLVLCFLALAIAATTLSADPWFNHKFGELRAYHKDWLNVCNDSGAGTCRAVQYKLAEGESFFGESRLALIFRGDGLYDIEVYDQGLDPLPFGDVVFDFGSDRIVLGPNKWRAGAVDRENVLETITVTDRETAFALTDLIREKSRLNVTFVVEDGPTSEASFSLRGSAAALFAIEALKSP